MEDDSVAQEALKERKKTELITKARDKMLSDRQELVNELTEGRVKVDPEYNKLVMIIEARQAILDNLILEINDLELEKEELVKELKDKHIFSDKKYKEMSKKIDNLSSKLPVSFVNMQNYYDNMLGVNNNGSLWYDAKLQNGSSGA